METAPQSCNIADLMTSIEKLISFSTGLKTGTQILEYYGGETRFTGSNVIKFAIVGMEPVKNYGAGRRGHVKYLVLSVKVCSRFAQDKPGSDKQWSRDATRGHWVYVQNAINSLQDQIISSAYDSTTQTPTASSVPLVTATCQMMDGPGPIKPSDDDTWGETEIKFSIPINQRLTI